MYNIIHNIISVYYIFSYLIHSFEGMRKLRFIQRGLTDCPRSHSRRWRLLHLNPSQSDARSLALPTILYSLKSVVKGTCIDYDHLYSIANAGEPETLYQKKKNREWMKEKCLAMRTYKYGSNIPNFNKREMNYEIIEGGSIWKWRHWYFIQTS